MDKQHLKEQVSAWREFARVLRDLPIDHDSIVEACAVEECADELEQLINGNLSSIEKI